MLKANYHTHTTMCDGDNTAEEMVQEAIRIGFKHLGFSGHMDSNIHMDWNAYTAEICRLRWQYADRLDILCGVELDNLFDPNCCPGAEYRIGSTHFLDIESPRSYSVDESVDVYRWLAEEYFGGNYLAMCKAYYECEAHVVERTHCTFVGHFDLITKFNDEVHFVDETSPAYLDPAKETMEYLVSTGTPFEINCGAYNRGRKSVVYPRPELLCALREFGGSIFISSDAHQKERLNGEFTAAVQEARKAGFTHVVILTHNPLTHAVEEQELALDTL